jgi:hypothetical protein
MEDGDQQPNSGQGENKANAAKPQVNVVGRDNDTFKGKLKNASMKIQGKISALIRWIHDQLRKAASKFLEIHRLEITWVQKNGKLNQAIAAALDAKNFSITVNNYPAYNVNVEKIKHINVDHIVNLANGISSENDRRLPQNAAKFQANTLFKAALPQDLQNKITPEMSEDQMKEIVQNWVLYDGQQPPQQTQQAKPITGDDFKDLCTNILEAEKALQGLSPISDALTKAAEALKKQTDAQNSQQNTNNNNNNNANNNNNQPQPPTNGLDDAQQALTKLANVYALVVTNTISNKFYKESYSVYRDIVQAYNQEGSPAGDQQASTDNTQPADNANNQGGGNNNG